MSSSSSVPCNRKRGLSEIIDDTSLNDAGLLVVSNGPLPFSRSRKIRDMSPNEIMTYFPNLSARTQYLDFQPLLIAILEPGAYWESLLRTWREVGTSQSIERL